MILFLFLLMMLPLALLPVILAYRRKDNVLLIASLISGVLIFLVIPWIICLVLVCRRYPKTVKPPVPFGAFAGLWALILLAFFICPFMSYGGLAVNGFTFFSVISFSSSGATTVVFFLLCTIAALIASFFLRERAILTGQPIVTLLSLEFYLILCSNIFAYELQAFGIYLLLFLYLAGEGLLLYSAWQISGQAVGYGDAGNGININKESLAHGLNKLAGSAQKLSGKLSQENAPNHQAPTGPGYSQGYPTAPSHGQAHQGYPATSSNAQAAQGYPAASAHAQAPQGYPAASRPTPSWQPHRIQVHCLGGQYTDAVFPLKDGENLCLGTDPQNANLVFDAPEISRRHCTITCTSRRNMVQITDTSSNGTYRKDGSRLPKGVTAEYPLPCYIFFGNQPEVFEIKEAD